MQAWTGSRSITLNSSENIQLPTHKLCNRVSLYEPLAFHFTVTVQPFGRFVARHHRYALAVSKSGDRCEGGLPQWGSCAAQRGGGSGCGRASKPVLSHYPCMRSGDKGRGGEGLRRSSRVVGSFPRMERRVFDPK